MGVSSVFLQGCQRSWQAANFHNASQQFLPTKSHSTMEHSLTEHFISNILPTATAQSVSHEAASQANTVQQNPCFDSGREYFIEDVMIHCIERWDKVKENRVTVASWNLYVWPHRIFAVLHSQTF